MKIFKFEKFINESDMSDLISRATVKKYNL